MKKNDAALIAVLVLFSLVPIFFAGGDKNFAVVKISGKVFRKIDLNENKIFTLETDAGKNIIEVKDKKIAVISADCPDKICVKAGAIKNVGEIIACVPHEILIEIGD